MLEIDGIDVYYGPVQALRGVSISVGEGEMVALLGSNGAGKTTTLRTASGMLNPKQGSITIDGRDASTLAAHEVVRLGVAHMPQGRELFSALTVEENLRLGHWSRRQEPQLRERMDRVYELFPKLAQRRKQQSGTMSGGEQQMLTVGRALMSEPKVLLVDEASLGLAPIIVEQLYEAIAAVNRRWGTAVLLVDQFIHLALRYTTRAYVLEKGEVVLEGRSEEIAGSTELLAAYLGGSVPDADADAAPAAGGGDETARAATVHAFVAQATVNDVLDAVAAGELTAAEALAAEETGRTRVGILQPLRAVLADDVASTNGHASATRQ